MVSNQCYGNGHVGLLLWSGGGNVVMSNASWGNGRAQYQFEKPDKTNVVMQNTETDPRRWPLKVRPEPSGGIWVPTAAVQVWE